ncbi:MAG TPA: hypothetical protein VN914_08950, partial [Polyangia bacterium]|nr:hypothetical protein [Polyangia bacterium]
ASPPPSQPFDPGALPLEAVVEREAVRSASRLNQRLAAEAGLHFLRLLAAGGEGKLRAAYLAQYPLPALGAADRKLLDDESLRFLALVESRSLDGAQLFKDLVAALRPPAGPPGLPPKPAVPAADKAKVIAVGQAYLTWFEALFVEPTGPDSAWSADRLEYSFAVSAQSSPSELVLSVPSYTQGRLDWYSFDLDRSGATLGAATPPPPPPASVKLSITPSPVRFKGMPAHRFWELEDGNVNLDAMDVAPVDLPRMLLTEFAFLHANDWFVIPWQMAVGSLARVKSLVVRDGFGDVRTIRSSRSHDKRWSMFRLSESGAAPFTEPFEDVLFMAPALATELSGDSLEEVVFARDEMANLAWAVERTVEGPTGDGFSRHEAFQARVRRADAEGTSPPGTPPADAAERIYQLQTPIPDYWIPMVPILLPSSPGQFRLRRGLLDRPEGPAPAIGRLLQPERALIMHEEEVPRVGAKVTRGFRYTRWTAGQSPLWIKRIRTTSRGEASSGLRYDFVK